MRTLWRWLLSPCLFGHQPRVWERYGTEMVQVCPRCRDRHPIRLVLP